MNQPRPRGRIRMPGYALTGGVESAQIQMDDNATNQDLAWRSDRSQSGLLAIAHEKNLPNGIV